MDLEAENISEDELPVHVSENITENISEDELPAVQVVKVPETEEVSDEELPGPKRAELPADTEVFLPKLDSELENSSSIP